MSSDDTPELNAAQRESLQQGLVALREELEHTLDDSGDAERPVQLDEPIGRVSRIDAIQVQQMARANRQGMTLRLRQVRAALERCADGSYGACVSCENPIRFARLEARPETPFCIECQSRRERN